MKKKLFLSALMILIPCLIFSQEYTEIFDNVWGMGENYSKPVFCDLDNDGLLDLIIGNQDGKLAHYIQDAASSTSFTLVSDFFNEIDVGEFSTPSFTDLDDDGLLDLIIGGQSGKLYHYEQDAVNSLNFTLVTQEFNGIDLNYDSLPCFTDLDNDGLLDMIVGERAGNLNHYKQDAVGSENFTLLEDTLSGILAEWRPRPIFTDLDNDNLLDLIVGGISGNLQHYEQDVTGSFTFILISEQFNDIDVGDYSSPWFTDFNEDGILDLIIGEEKGNINHYEQDTGGSVTFHLITEKLVNGIIDVGVNAAPAFADLDNDGLFDLIIGENDGTLYYYEQDESGSSLFNFISDNFNGIDVGNYSAPIFTDLNNNGLYDLIVGEWKGNLNYYEQDAVGSTTFNFITDSLAGIDVGSYSSPCVIDLYNDGLLDLIIGEEGGHLRHYVQDAAGSTSFSWVSDSLSRIDIGIRSSPCFTDLDNDGLLDLLVGENASSIKHYKQDAVGSTSFTLISDRFNEMIVSAAKPVFVDINGDGMDDLLIGNYYGGIHYFQRIDDTFVADHIPDSTPHSFKLFQNYPNPFNPTTSIGYYLPKAGKVNISIYNSLGQKVRILENGYRQAGSHTVQWDSKDEHGISLSSGLYICHLQTYGYSHLIKLMLLK